MMVDTNVSNFAIDRILFWLWDIMALTWKDSYKESEEYYNRIGLKISDERHDKILKMA
jgi:hypothetical protein